MNTSYYGSLVILSIAVAVIASYVALDLASRITASQGSAAARYWLVGGAISMGIGIWSMHFIGMLALRLPIAMSYDVSTTMLSLLIACIVSGFALHTINTGELTTKRLLGGGAAMGLGIASMHYTGMDAMQMQPPIRYDSSLLIVSILIAIVAAVAALWIAFRLRFSTARSAFWVKGGAALVMGAAISGMHYTGMVAARFAPDSICTVSPQDINNAWLAGIVGVFAFMVLATTMLISLFDIRLTGRAARFAEELRERNAHLAQQAEQLTQANRLLEQEMRERSRMERALRESEAQFKSAFDFAPIGIALVSIEGRWLRVNRAVCEIVGYSEQELLATTFQDVTHPDDLASDLEVVRRLLNGEIPAYQIEKRYVQKGGRSVWVLLNVSLVRGEQGVPICFIAQIQDIRERKQTEHALERSRRFLGAIVDAIPQPLFVKGRDHRFLMVNAAFAAFCSQPREALLGKSDHELVPHEQADVFVERDKRVFLDGQASVHEEEISDGRGETRRIVTRKALFRNAEGNNVLVGVINDITELKQIQAALAKSEEEHRLLAEHSSDLIVRMTPAGILTYASPASAAVLGYRPEELVGRAVPDFIHPEDWEEAESRYLEVVRDNKVRVVTSRLRTGDGRWVWTETSFRALRSPQRERATQVIGVCRNIEERVRVTEALKAANQDLAQHRAIDEEEKRVAKHVLDQLVRNDRGLADRVSTWILPARYFSGDVVAVTETPSRVLHVLLADGTGHGLSAALGALPAVQPFYAMSHKGFGIGAIVREMNAKIRELLPTGRFIAATVASIDASSGIVQIWNGGNPSCFLMDDNGKVLRAFSSTHLALGILSDEEFDAHVETVKFDADSQLVMVSDGLVDARNDTHEVFGEERVARFCAEALPSARLVYLRSVIHGHLHYQQPEDDISVVLARCRRLPAAEVVPSTHTVVCATEEASGCGLHLVLSVEQLKRADVVPALCTLFKELHLVSAFDAPVFVVLTELFNNALDHGLLGLASGLKGQGEDLEVYLAERGRRLAGLADGAIDIQAERLASSGQPSLRLVIRDTGQGFDFTSVLKSDAEISEARHGRGIALVSALCTTVEYRDGGRVVEALLPLAA